MINKLTYNLKRKYFEKKLGIDPKDRVLEVGSGHRPNPRADVLTDKYFESTEERGGDIYIDNRPFHMADICNLPFEDKEFDYVIASHVIEHVENPQKALEEIMRIGNRGYIECPSLFWELFRPTRRYHRWVILNIDEKLIFYDKSKIDLPIFGDIFESDGLESKSPFLNLFFKQYSELFIVNFRWEKAIEFIINPESWEYRRFFEEPYDMDKINRISNNPKKAYEVLAHSIIKKIKKELSGRW